MKKFLLLAVLVAAIGVVAAPAEAGRWIPGTPYMISEEDANDFLDDVVDQAFCTGIPRFGTRGEFPYEEFVVFDCTISHKGVKADIFCSDVRYRAVKGSKRGYYRMKGNLLKADCF